MNTASRSPCHLTARAIRAVIGPFDMEVLIRILAIEPSIEEVQIAYKCFGSDEHRIRGINIELADKAKTIYAYP